MNSKWCPVSEACLDTFPASGVTLINYECKSIISLESVLRNYFSLACS